ncbi:hypothetical protein LB566_30210 [Mesorhizobium sp. CA13]|jgi:hypothetical protein|uniref:hypothetical protein n=1 Tax=unclassified Mesorhizobium TaxID=325217 RepID=UPI00112C347D|nr:MULTISPECIES: hypothetical protein [unclassified Mesorhizobium]MBZ9858053.1 hypothetical protein [Mesorhizobium sp. CA13]MBZ9921590.1 hypothetical protein [Mesorhizobium sp. BR1-1-7]MBZ9967923.1 hypothetical protein [Mesorhizobium sp. BR1-1-2]MCA0014913.1 hypothetical protein [Mesorhizobium sp. B294B1A1]MCA0040967.1 hypothetical protein [Mesorhizobium sp. B292B1B]
MKKSAIVVAANDNRTAQPSASRRKFVEADAAPADLQAGREEPTEARTLTALQMFCRVAGV